MDDGWRAVSGERRAESRGRWAGVEAVGGGQRAGMVSGGMRRWAVGVERWLVICKLAVA